MQPLALTVVALVAAGAVSAVAWPLLRGAPESRPGPHRDDAATLRLLEHRDRTLAALKELEFDHRTGKVSDDDYRALVGPLRLEAAHALRQLAVADGDRRGAEVASTSDAETGRPLVATASAAE